MKCRKNVKELDDDERNAFVQAILKLKDPTEPGGASIIPAAQDDGAESRYDDYVWLHQVALNAATNIHGGAAFGPWHREMLRQFEADLRTVSGDDTITVPYWDWTRARQAGDDGWPFTPEFLGGFGGVVTDGPFAFSGGNWTINIKDVPGTSDALTRVVAPNPTTDPEELGEDEVLLPIPFWNQFTMQDRPYDALPWHEDDDTTEDEFFSSFRKILEGLLHNPVHNWVGGNMADAASPNDPVFFLHHAAIDRLWSIWQDKWPQTDYLPTSGANPGHNLGDDMSVTNPAFYNLPPLRRPMDHLDLHSTDVWYDSDLPRISPPSTTVAFGGVDEDLTTHRPLTFSVEGCREVRFRVTGMSGDGIGVPSGWMQVIEPKRDDFTARDVTLYVEFDAAAALAAGASLDAESSGSVMVEAYIIDDEALFADAEGGEFIIDSWTFNTTATPISRRSAIAFVSDRSGSMSGDAGGGTTKFQLLTEALEVVTDLMDSNDAASLVFFDDAITTPLPLAPLSAGSVTTVLEGSAIQPAFGSTAIGLGLIEGVSQLSSVLSDPSSVYDNTAVVCLTDGNENIHPFVLEEPVPTEVAALDGALYAIGLGREGNVSEDTLGAISKYMLITGTLDADERRFLLTKYFVQILAGIKGNEIVVDPQGRLGLEDVAEIPFDLCEADVAVDLIVLSPVAPLLDISLTTPGGHVIEAGALGGATLDVHRLDTRLRVGLPVAAAGAGGHAGRWTARVRLSSDRIRALTKARSAKSQTHRDDGVASALFDHAAKGSVPYSAIVQTRSNLAMSVYSPAEALAPGEALSLVVALSQYGLALPGTISARATVTDPLGRVSEHQLVASDDGLATLNLPAAHRGIYQCRVRVRGRSRAGRVFMREQTRTFSVKPTALGPATGRPESGNEPRDELCRLLRCLAVEPAVAKLLERNGIDARRLAACVCAGDPGDGRPEEPGPCAEHDGKNARGSKLAAASSAAKEDARVRFADPVRVPHAQVAAAFAREAPPAIEAPSHPTPATGMVMSMAHLDLDGTVRFRMMDHSEHGKHEKHGAHGIGEDVAAQLLSDVSGIARHHVSMLRHHGVTTVGELLETDAEELGSWLSLAPARVVRLLRSARTATPMPAAAHEPSDEAEEGSGDADDSASHEHD
ncbi:MAG: tyrosinase family protein [Myxococcota bacterium]